jgi:hypothetical protein
VPDGSPLQPSPAVRGFFSATVPFIPLCFCACSGERGLWIDEKCADLQGGGGTSHSICR